MRNFDFDVIYYLKINIYIFVFLFTRSGRPGTEGPVLCLAVFSANPILDKWQTAELQFKDCLYYI